MHENDEVVFSKQVIKEIIVELKSIDLMIDDIIVSEKLDKVMELINKTCEVDVSVSLLDMIHEKMKETKNTNEDVHLNLYMLYRKLQDGKISVSEAMSIFKNYIRL